MSASDQARVLPETYEQSGHGAATDRCMKQCRSAARSLEQSQSPVPIVLACCEWVQQ